MDIQLLGDLVNDSFLNKFILISDKTVLKKYSDCVSVKNLEYEEFKSENDALKKEVAELRGASKPDTTST
jgi:hypothetical protein